MWLTSTTNQGNYQDLVAIRHRTALTMTFRADNCERVIQVNHVDPEWGLEFPMLISDFTLRNRDLPQKPCSNLTQHIVILVCKRLL